MWRLAFIFCVALIPTTASALQCFQGRVHEKDAYLITDDFKAGTKAEIGIFKEYKKVKNRMQPSFVFENIIFESDYVAKYENGNEIAFKLEGRGKDLTVTDSKEEIYLRPQCIVSRFYRFSNMFDSDIKFIEFGPNPVWINIRNGKKSDMTDVHIQTDAGQKLRERCIARTSCRIAISDLDLPSLDGGMKYEVKIEYYCDIGSGFSHKLTESKPVELQCWR